MPETTIPDLQLCAGCGQPFVVPDEILRVLTDGRSYLARLRCTNCDRVTHGTFDEAAMTVLDHRLEEGHRQLSADLAAVERARMREDVEAFAAALDDDLITPEDF